MTPYIILLRGINVGGKNKVPMVDLKKCLTDLGYSDVSTYIASGNAILKSHKSAAHIKADIEAVLPKAFKLDSDLVKVLVLTRDQLQSVIKNKPKHFGDEPTKYHCDVIFLIDIPTAQAMTAFSPKEGVDTIWEGGGVIYSQRLSTLRTKSHLSKIAASPAYKSMTVRNWNTTTRLLELVG